MITENHLAWIVVARKGMRQEAIDILRRLISDYISENKLTQQAFCDRTGGVVSRQALMKLLQRESRLIDAETLAGYALALDMNVAPLMQQMGILTPVADDDLSLINRLQRTIIQLPKEEKEKLVNELQDLLDKIG
jgi:transcriptional regulator with XRE-family HTH domain